MLLPDDLDDELSDVLQEQLENQGPITGYFLATFSHGRIILNSSFSDDDDTAAAIIPALSDAIEGDAEYETEFAGAA